MTTWLSQTKKEDSWTAVSIDENLWRNLNVEQTRTVVENVDNVDLVVFVINGCLFSSNRNTTFVFLVTLSMIKD